jgi:hypothetical protein
VERDQAMELRKQYQYESQRYKDRIAELEQMVIDSQASLQMENRKSRDPQNNRGLEEERAWYIFMKKIS